MKLKRLKEVFRVSFCRENTKSYMARIYGAKYVTVHHKCTAWEKVMKSALYNLRGKWTDVFHYYYFFFIRTNYFPTTIPVPTATGFLRSTREKFLFNP